VSALRNPPTYAARDDNGRRTFLILDNDRLVHQCASVDSEDATDRIEGLSARVWRAAGMVSIQADCTFDEAVVLMQERAAVHSQTLEEVAIGVIGHLIGFG